MISLLQGDCLERMNEIPDGSVDMVLCDLPYGIVNWTNPYEWDSALDLRTLFGQYRRVLRNLGAIVLFGTEPYSTFQRTAAPDLYKYDIVWIKNRVSSPYLAKVKPLRSVELISVFSEGTTSPGRLGNMPYYPQGLVRKPRTVKNSKKNRMVFQARPSTKDEYVQEFTGYPKDFVEFPLDVDSVHPTQKPVDLLRYLIRTYTLPGETVLDNTMGSGSTAVAAIREGRSFIGIEMDESYFQIAKDRVESEIISDYWGGL